MLTFFLVCAVCLLATANAQQAVSLAGRCDRRTAYFFGVCRVGTCLGNETLLQGNSYCDVYRAFMRAAFVRCTATLPCCFSGGQCRQRCGARQSPRIDLTDCAAARRGSVCCTPNTQGNVPLVNVPLANVPQANVPRANVPQANVPRANVPLANVPQANIPLANPPRTNGPLTPVNQVGGTRQCGARDLIRGRLLPGAANTPVRWPWVVRLVHTGNATGAPACDGVLVGDDTVVTVSQCVARTQADQLQARVGAFDLTRTDPEEEVIGVRHIETDRNFLAGRLGNDLAVLTLTRPIIRTQNREPICLPQPTVPLLRPPRCFVAGWGVTSTGQVNNQLRVAPVQFMDQRLCGVMIASASPTINVTSLGSDTTCTQPIRNDPAGCLFDDGGMLSCLDTANRYSLVGLVNQFSCGNQPTVYTRVDNHLPAILARH